MTAIVMLLAGLLSLGIMGCGGPPRAARTALAVTAAGVRSADAASVSAHAERQATCFDSEETASEYRQCVAAFDSLTAGLEASRSALFATEAALDAWEVGATDDASFIALVPCLGETLAQLMRLIGDVGLTVPDELQTGVRLVRSFVGRCVQ